MANAPKSVRDLRWIAPFRKSTQSDWCRQSRPNFGFLPPPSV